MHTGKSKWQNLACRLPEPAAEEKPLGESVLCILYLFRAPFSYPAVLSPPPPLVVMAIFYDISRQGWCIALEGNPENIVAFNPSSSPIPGGGCVFSFTQVYHFHLALILGLRIAHDSTCQSYEPLMHLFIFTGKDHSIWSVTNIDTGELTMDSAVSVMYISSA